MTANYFGTSRCGNEKGADELSMFKATALRELPMRGHDPHNVRGFLPSSDNCPNYSHLFQIHRKQDQDGGSQVNRPYLRLYWYPPARALRWSTLQQQEGKCTFRKPCLIDGLDDLLDSRRENTGSMWNCDQLPGDVIGDWADWVHTGIGSADGQGEPVSDYKTSMFCSCCT